MTHPEHAPENFSPTAEYINMQTQFILRGSYDADTYTYPPSKKAFLDHVGRLREVHGEDGVLTSFYLNPDHVIRLGIFTRPDPDKPPEDDEASLHVKGGRLATQDTVVLPRQDDSNDLLYP